ncbi:hypothetical protein NQ318_021538 [Aromia moschata]|uniref:PX domain-containing protein n=1 Tax=Aromia moschata TaxID=1265417 RepID=A0AAV8ZE19_9CUCU|nr:hypothetical protein NQ318_021538 [Aromia moschata]
MDANAETLKNDIKTLIPVKTDTLLNHLEISVSESEKRANGSLNLRDFYTVYLIETKLTDPSFQQKLGKLTTVWRRYTEFEQLRDYLEVTYPYIVLPPLPEKRVMFGWQKISNDTFDPNFIDRRRAGLENFFVSAVKDYGATLHTNLNNLLKARSRVAEKQYTVHKLHANYGRVFSEWSAIEKEMGDALQKTGHYLDSLASSIDAGLEDEELLADQFKEYLFFAVSLQNVCKNREMLQLELEDAEENVANKNVERTKVQQGKTGLMSRLFGAVDTDEVREFKVNLLDQQIQEGATAVSTTRHGLSDFSSKALGDIERFQNQKVLDLRDTLASCAFLQLKIARKGLQTWLQIRDCLQNIP